jgi:hypothetical protein
MIAHFLMAKQAELSIQTADQEHPPVPHCRITLLMKSRQKVPGWSESAAKKCDDTITGSEVKFLG